MSDAHLRELERRAAQGDATPEEVARARCRAYGHLLVAFYYNAGWHVDPVMAPRCARCGALGPTQVVAANDPRDLAAGLNAHPEFTAAGWVAIPCDGKVRLEPRA